MKPPFMGDAVGLGDLGHIMRYSTYGDVEDFYTGAHGKRVQAAWGVQTRHSWYSLP